MQAWVATMVLIRIDVELMQFTRLHGSINITRSLKNQTVGRNSNVLPDPRVYLNPEQVESMDKYLKMFGLYS